MKKAIIAVAAVFISCCFCLRADAQPRAAGVRIGATGFDLSYQHTLGKNFVEAEAGVDFGYAGGTGFKTSATYNIVYARPAWTDMGSWGLYAGSGLALGYVSDRVAYNVNVDGKKARIPYPDKGFMFSFVLQAGIEYNFWFPLQLSFDIRPYFGLHVSNLFGYNKTNFYSYGMMGFIPTLSARYRF